ncbi:YdeI/OmpD-associated family protein [Allomuricauda taeanensis]|uniref:YdeI/OmpD-associated family protein n=1 Tax=Flagellimonas taeanensis TaxID=1005926 RepID=UPI002E7B89B8|nr:YdeI/OmpD-associated family protein [Allomuricauda taeanensis]MEE1963452.1 YdeI/OmpD-associated family protein [Allomuricauda taeanensis]
MNPEIDAYLQEGCGRCPLGGTPECKVHSWTAELKYLRRLVLECGLTEEQKWGVPTYTHNGTNLVVVAAFKDNCTLSFFKGALLKDDHQILEKPGENTQSGRVIRFTDVAQIAQLESVLKNYIFEAIEVKRAGLKVQLRSISDYDIPEEFQQRLEEDPELKEAFENLTPGRKKGYLLYFSGAKQAKTREDRIEKYIPKIMKGLGFHDR